MKKTLVLGIGNTLLQDEALGVRAVQALEREFPLPEEVLVMDGGTLGLELLPYFLEAQQVLILDAMQMGLPSGSLCRLEGEAIPAAFAQKLSMHQVGLQDLLAALQFCGTQPQTMVLWGMQPHTIDWGLELTNEISTALPSLVNAALSELRAWEIIPAAVPSLAERRPAMG